MNFTILNALKAFMLRDKDHDTEQTLAIAIAFTLPVASVEEDVARSFYTHVGKVDIALNAINEEVVIDIAEIRTLIRLVWLYRNYSIFEPQLDVPEILVDMTKEQCEDVKTLIVALRQVM